MEPSRATSEPTSASVQDTSQSLEQIANALNTLFSAVSTLQTRLDILSTHGEGNTPSTLSNEASVNPEARPSSLPRDDATSVPSRRIKPATPGEFDGNREQGCTFLNSCTLYISLAPHEFTSEADKVHWAFSYMKKGRAAEQVNRWLEGEAKSGYPAFASWKHFAAEFETQFCPVNVQETAVITLESERYYQGKDSVEDYTDRFKDLIHRSGYVDPIVTTVKYRCGLNASIESDVANKPGCPSFNDPTGTMRQ